MKLKYSLFPFPLRLEVRITKAPPSAGCDGLTYFEGDTVKVDVNGETANDDVRFHSVVAHEMSHVVDFIDEFINAKTDGETRAYFIQSLMQKILNDKRKKAK